MEKDMESFFRVRSAKRRNNRGNENDPNSRQPIPKRDLPPEKQPGESFDFKRGWYMPQKFPRKDN